MELSIECICRICFQELDLQPLFDKDEDGLIIADKIMKCFSLKMEQSENYPQQICDTCLSELNAAYRFRQNCENANVLLLKLTKARAEKEEITDSVQQQLADGTETTKPNTDNSLEVEQSQTVKSSSISSLVDELESCVVYIELDSETDPLLPNIKLEDENQIKVEEENEIELGSGTVQEANDNNILSRHTNLDSIAPQKRKFECQFCEKKFLTDYSRIVHERTHSGNPIKFRQNCENANALLLELTKVKVEKEIITDCVQQQLDDGTETTEPITDNSPEVEQSQTVKSSSISSLVDELESCVVYVELDSETDPLLPNIKLEDETQIKVEEENEIELGSGTVQEANDNNILNRDTNLDSIAPQKNKFKYQFCEKKFLTDYSRIVHESTHSGNPIKCEICGKVFLKPYSLRRHISNIHDAKRRRLKKQYRCGECGRRFPIESFFNRHLQELGHNEFSDAYNLKRQMLNKGPYSCNFCDKKFHHATTRDQHERLHSDNPLKCEICEKIIGGKPSLRAHVLKFHSRRRKQHKCGDCGRQFIAEAKLRHHMQSLGHHKIAEDKRGCEKCGKGFENEQQLAVHKQMHHPPFTCSICGGKFLKSHNLDQHIILHHRAGPYPCSFCGKKFFTEDKQRRHERLVHPFKCMVCEETFPTVPLLKEHILDHIDDAKNAERSENKSIRFDEKDPVPAAAGSSYRNDPFFNGQELPNPLDARTAVFEASLPQQHEKDPSDTGFDVVAIAEKAGKNSNKGPDNSNDNDVVSYKIVFK